MSTPNAAHQALPQLKVGDRVVVKRVLDHPAHMKQVETEYGTSWVPDKSVRELIGITTVTETRFVPAVPGWRGRDEQRLARLASGLWYDLADGLQHHCGATRIELPQQ